MKRTQKTEDKITELEDQGYKIIDGNNPFLNKHKKYAGFECIRIAQTNSRRHGKSINTVWAVRKIEAII